MGCTLSKRQFVVNAKIEGQDQAALNVLLELGLSKRDIDVLYTAFWDMDADESGTVQPAELFAYFEVESTPFERGVFCLFDEDHSGIINFMEFACSLWNILTLDETNMGCLAFMIADPTALRTLSYTDIKDLFESMHKKKIERDPALRDMMGYLKRDLNRAIKMQDFTKWAHQHPSILTPLRMLQTHLRFQIIGPNFWSKMTEVRREHKEMGKFDYIPQLQKRVIQETRLFLNKGEGDIREKRRLARRGRGPNGDNRDNVIRKQSLLVRYFGLSRFSVADARQGGYGSGTGSGLSQNKVLPEGQQHQHNKHHHKHSAHANHEENDLDNNHEQHSTAAALPRRRRSSFLLGRRPVLVFKSEMPEEPQKKATSKRQKKDKYQEALAAAAVIHS